MSSQIASAAVPNLLSCHAVLRQKEWLLRFSADLQPIVAAAAGQLRPALAVALSRALARAGRQRWRTAVEAEGQVFSVAVDEESGVILVASPRFGAEQAIVRAVADHGFLPADAVDAWRQLSNLEAFVAGWHAADAQNAPAIIQTAAAADRFVDVLDAKSSEMVLLLEDIEGIAAKIQKAILAYRPGLLERLSQLGLGLNAKYAILRVHALRFVAALPSLDHDKQGAEVVRLLRETLRRIADDSATAQRREATGERSPLPPSLLVACKFALTATRWLPRMWVAALTRLGVRTLARIFIAGEDMHTAWPALQSLRDSGRDATLDQLGELVVSEAEADVYRDRVMQLIEGLGQRYAGVKDAHNAAGIQRAHVSIKVSALCSDFNPDDGDGTWARVGPRLTRILLQGKQNGVFINLDAEHYSVRDLNFSLLKRALSETADLRAHPAVGLVVQCYLRDAAAHLAEVIEFCRLRGVRMPLRLVKGAYWDAETMAAAANDYLAPQFLNKAETDAMFQALCLQVLCNGDLVQLCVGSHNLRDHCFADAARRRLFPQAPPIEHQALHMTYEALSQAMAKQGWAVRNYIPVGSLLVGMAYLVRRILENSSQVGVLTLAREGVELGAVLVTPAARLLALRDEGGVLHDDLVGADPSENVSLFRNVAPVRLDRRDVRIAFHDAIAAEPFWAKPLESRGRTGQLIGIYSPSAPEHLVGSIRTARASDVDAAVERAQTAQDDWGFVPVGQRAALLIRAAEQLRAQRLAFAVLVAHEAGKARPEALGDVDEAIDFMQYYAREALRLESAPTAQLQGLGAVAVVAPWNFPLAIPCGMASAALVAGNSVLLKSSEQTPLVVERWIHLLHTVGVPESVIQHLPGDGAQVGAPLVQHCKVAASVFTGSRAVGTWIYTEMLRRSHHGRLRRAITEMGGKNAIIVTANADLDEAVSGCVQAAFGHAGQKCSAASRILVDARVATAFAERFAQALSDLKVGLALQPGTRVNPVISAKDQTRLQQLARAMRDEARACGGSVLVDRSEISPANSAYLVGPTAVRIDATTAMSPHSLAQKELFGPLVHVIAFVDLAQAIALANSTPFALTGGIFSQSQDDLDWLTPRFVCGNLYINRPITGARVAIEPFGGHRMSGTGPKAGGPDYLRQFYRIADQPRVKLSNPAAALLLGDSDAGHDPISVHDNGHLNAAEGLQLAARLLRDWPPKLRSDWAQPARRLLHHALRDLPGLYDKSDKNRSIPGQDSHNCWASARGPVALIVGREHPAPLAAAHLLAGLITGNSVTILAVGADAAQAWRDLAAELGLDIPIVVPTNLASLRARLQLLHWATVVLDSGAGQYEPILSACCAVPEGAVHLRAVRDNDDAVQLDDLTAILRCHLHVKTVAVHTMRHGAPLTLDL